MTSDAFQEFGKVEVAKEQLMMPVKGPRITGRQSDRSFKHKACKFAVCVVFMIKAGKR